MPDRIYSSVCQRNWCRKRETNKTKQHSLYQLPILHNPPRVTNNISFTPVQKVVYVCRKLWNGIITVNTIIYRISSCCIYLPVQKSTFPPITWEPFRQRDVVTEWHYWVRQWCCFSAIAERCRWPSYKSDQVTDPRLILSLLKPSRSNKIRHGLQSPMAN
jgi:hypothetical protein